MSSGNLEITLPDGGPDETPLGALLSPTEILKNSFLPGYDPCETSMFKEQWMEFEDESQESEDQFSRQYRSESELRSLFEDDEEQLEEDEVKSQHSETATEKSAVEASNSGVVNAETDAINTGGVLAGAVIAEDVPAGHVKHREVNVWSFNGGLIFMDVNSGSMATVLSHAEMVAEYYSPTGNGLVKDFFGGPAGVTNIEESVVKGIMDLMIAYPPPPAPNAALYTSGDVAAVEVNAGVANIAHYQQQLKFDAENASILLAGVKGVTRIDLYTGRPIGPNTEVVLLQDSFTGLFRFYYINSNVMSELYSYEEMMVCITSLIAPNDTGGLAAEIANGSFKAPPNDALVAATDLESFLDSVFAGADTPAGTPDNPLAMGASNFVPSGLSVESSYKFGQTELTQPVETIAIGNGSAVPTKTVGMSFVDTGRVGELYHGYPGSAPGVVGNLIPAYTPGAGAALPSTPPHGFTFGPQNDGNDSPPDPPRGRTTHARTVSDTSSTGLADDQSPVDLTQDDVEDDAFEAQANKVLASNLGIPLEEFKKLKMHSAKNLLNFPPDVFYQSQKPPPVVQPAVEKRMFTDKKTGRTFEYNHVERVVDYDSSYNNISDDHTKLPRSMCIILGLQSPEDLDNMDDEGLQKAVDLAVSLGVRHPALTKATARMGQLLSSLTSAGNSTSSSIQADQALLHGGHVVSSESSNLPDNLQHIPSGLYSIEELLALEYAPTTHAGQDLAQNGDPVVFSETSNTSTNLPNPGPGNPNFEAMQRFLADFNANQVIRTIRDPVTGELIVTCGSDDASANPPAAGSYVTSEEELYAMGFRRPDPRYPGGLPPLAAPENDAPTTSAIDVKYDMDNAGHIWKDLYLSGKFEEASMVLAKAYSIIKNGTFDHMFAIEMYKSFVHVCTAAFAQLKAMGVNESEYMLRGETSMARGDPDDITEVGFLTRVRNFEEWKDKDQVKDAKCNRISQTVKAVQVLAKYQQIGGPVTPSPSKKRKSVSTPNTASPKKKAPAKVRTPSKPRAASGQRTPSQFGKSTPKAAASIQFGVIPEHLSGDSAAQVAFLQGQIAIMQQLQQAENDQ
ncbi:hypothetical protein BDZ45DRAFT_764297 [Acephala macrosclerotiorum]|nr:hypothetical protein BDZ45DRAFT_764297 [Acephala macrosclerotiorum]